MRRTTILNPKEVKRTTFHEAEEAFFKHCKLKNLRPRSLEYQGAGRDAPDGGQVYSDLAENKVSLYQNPQG